jgi:hypothetical protein
MGFGISLLKEKEQDLTREGEMVKAYRDTWHLGIHSYLSYLHDRLVVAKELLADSGGIFVQIGDENLHLVRDLLDEEPFFCWKYPFGDTCRSLRCNRPDFLGGILQSYRPTLSSGLHFSPKCQTIWRFPFTA